MMSTLMKVQKGTVRRSGGDTGEGRQWKEFLKIGENKEELIHLIGRYLSAVENPRNIRFPLIYTTGDETYKLDSEKLEMLYKCNHEDVDTRLILHSLQCKNDVVLVSKDTDKLVLLVWAYNRYNVKRQ